MTPLQRCLTTTCTGAAAAMFSCILAMPLGGPVMSSVRLLTNLLWVSNPRQEVSFIFKEAITMKVTVVGSYKPELSKRNKETEERCAEVMNQFHHACIKIGRSLAECGHQLIVAHGENPETAEALALKGFREVQ